jgi:hypothetical protein
VPGTTIELSETRDDGEFVLRVNGSERAIEERAAAGLYVKPL